MQENIEKMKQLLNENKISFRELAQKLSVSNQTLTRKMSGTTEWTFPEITILTELFHIEDPQNFFYN